MAADQLPDGSIGHVVPTLFVGSGSAAWDDAATICPWQIYLTYGDKEILARQFDCMKKYIGFITNTTRINICGPAASIMRTGWGWMRRWEAIRDPPVRIS